MKALIYVGCCNRPTPYFRTHNGSGIVILEMDLDSGRISEIGTQCGIDNPTFLTVHPSGRYLYASSEVVDWNEGTISAYDVDLASGKLRYINKQATLGNVTAFASFDRTARYLLAANYGMAPVEELPNQSIISLPIRVDGGLNPVTDALAHEGKGTNPERQERPHTHSVRASQDNRFVIVADLGTDALVSYAFDERNGRFGRGHTCRLPNGSGPRHFVFDATSTCVYLVNELSSTVICLSFDTLEGTFAPVAECSAIPPGVEENHSSEIVLAPSGRRLFVGNRGHDTISTVDIVPSNAGLKLRATTPSGGRTPRHMALDPTGRFLVVANQDSDRLSVFRLDSIDEALIPVGDFVTGSPTCVAFSPEFSEG